MLQDPGSPYHHLGVFGNFYFQRVLKLHDAEDNYAEE